MNKDLLPLISIIIPVYGVEEYISRCIETVALQTYKKIEIIIVDDCSPDNSIKIALSILEKYKNVFHDIKIVKHSANLGLSAARQSGIDACTGEYLFHLDSDDFLEIDAIQLLVDALNVDDYDIVIGATIHEYNDNIIEDYRAIRDNYSSFSKPSYLKDVILQDIPNSIWGKLIRTSLYKNNDIQCIKEISYAEDYAVYPRLLYFASSIGFVCSPVYHYTHYNESSYTNKYKWKNITDCFAAEKTIEDFFSSKQEYCQAIKIAHLRRSAWAIRQQLSNGHSTTDIKELILPLKFSIGDIRYLCLNHFIIIVLYKFGLSSLLYFFVVGSSKIIKKRKI